MSTNRRIFLVRVREGTGLIALSKVVCGGKNVKAAIRGGAVKLHLVGELLCTRGFRLVGSLNFVDSTSRRFVISYPRSPNQGALLPKPFYGTCWRE